MIFLEPAQSAFEVGRHCVGGLARRIAKVRESFLNTPQGVTFVRKDFEDVGSRRLAADAGMKYEPSVERIAWLGTVAPCRESVAALELGIELGDGCRLVVGVRVTYPDAHLGAIGEAACPYIEGDLFANENRVDTP